MTPSTNSDILLGVSSSSCTYNARPLPPAPLFLEHRGPSLRVQVITCHHDYLTTALCYSPGLHEEAHAWLDTPKSIFINTEWTLKWPTILWFCPFRFAQGYFLRESHAVLWHRDSLSAGIWFNYIIISPTSRRDYGDIVCIVDEAETLLIAFPLQVDDIY